MKFGLYVTLILIFSCSMSAQSSVKSLSVLAGGEFPYGDFADEDIFSGNGNADRGNSLKTKLEFHTALNFAVGFESGYYRFGEKKQVQDFDFSIQSIPLEMYIAYYFFQGQTSPFVSTGFGVNFLNFSFDRTDLSDSDFKLLGNFTGSVGVNAKVSNRSSIILLGQWRIISSKDDRFSFEKASLVLIPGFNATFFSLSAGYRIFFGK